MQVGALRFDRITWFVSLRRTYSQQQCLSRALQHEVLMALVSQRETASRELEASTRRLGQEGVLRGQFVWFRRSTQSKQEAWSCRT